MQVSCYVDVVGLGIGVGFVVISAVTIFVVKLAGGFAKSHNVDDNGGHFQRPQRNENVEEDDRNF